MIFSNSNLISNNRFRVSDNSATNVVLASSALQSLTTNVSNENGPGKSFRICWRSEDTSAMLTCSPIQALVLDMQKLATKMHRPHSRCLHLTKTAWLTKLKSDWTSECLTYGEDPSTKTRWNNLFLNEQFFSTLAALLDAQQIIQFYLALSKDEFIRITCATAWHSSRSMKATN